MRPKARAAFDIERVTKAFYRDFDTHRKAFLKFIDGIGEVANREWYASVMLNRLMFVYFIQRKGFLDTDPDYLRHRLERCKQEKGKDKFYTFYRYFLLRLFHEGFGKRRKDRAPDLEKLLGNIPYLNGGLFDVHELEKPENYGKDIQIPDKAFENIFGYFDQYQWHLDERPLRADNEINPDVLGYIFEKYINQKQMGAYYTKEDITEYISKNTVLPFLFDAARAKCKVAFENPNGPTVWDLLRENPDSYIYPAVRHGADKKIPPEITAGLDSTKPDLIKRRKAWNISAPSDYALPTEIWREVVARRQRYEEVKKKIAGGEVRDVNDFIALNLDLRQFAQDVIQNCEGPDLLMAFWQAISTITVLDPTGGSGAFIFAALNILDPLYESCLDRMEAFLAEWGESGRKIHPNYHKKFTEVLARVDAHPNRRYFVLKSIILNNLYAVDIMEEAVEICKLRLFLKLAAQVEPDASRDNLFPVLQYHELAEKASMFHGLLPKIGCQEAAKALCRIGSKRTIESLKSRLGRHKIYWVRVPGYFCQFLLEPPMARPEGGGAARVRGEVNDIGFDEKSTCHVAHAVLNSSTYYQFFCTYTDTRHINPSDVSEFPLDLTVIDNETKSKLVELSAKLSKCTAAHTAQWRKSGLLIDSIDSKPCKPLIDKIDTVLAAHYGFAAEELDFIMNYDIKFRLGRDTEAEDE